METPMTDKLNELQAERDQAVARRRDLDVQQRAARDRLGQLDERVRVLSETEQDQFGPDYSPKPKTDAARATAELRNAKLDSENWPNLIEGADRRLKATRRALDDFKRDNQDALADELHPAAIHVMANLDAALTAVVDATDQYFAVERKFTDLLGPISGIDGSDLPNADWVAALRREVERVRAEQHRPPAPRSMFPAPGETAPRKQTPNGWVSSQNQAPELAR